MKNETQLHESLLRFIQSHNFSRTEAAKSLGVTKQYLGQVLAGDKPIADTIAKKLGFKPVRMFQPITEDK